MIRSDLISVLIPVYNGVNTLGKCIDSVLAQSYSGLELIVWDDGSTDNTSDLVSAYLDDRISLVRSNDNLGIAKVRNELVKLAKGEYIAWLDADDFMMPTRLQEQINYLRCYPEVSVLGTSAILRNYKVKERSFYPNHDFIHSFQFYKSCTLFPTFLTKNFYAEDDLFFDESMGSRASDFEWIYRVGDKHKIANLDLPLTSYYVSSDEELELKWQRNNFKEKSMSLLKKKLNSLKVEFSNEQLHDLLNFMLSNNDISREVALSLYKLLRSARDSNNKVKIHEKHSFNAVTLLHCLRLRKYNKNKVITLNNLLKDFGLKPWLLLLRNRTYYH